jgi:hypothetical protein
MMWLRGCSAAAKTCCDMLLPPRPPRAHIQAAKIAQLATPEQRQRPGPDGQPRAMSFLALQPLFQRYVCHPAVVVRSYFHLAAASSHRHPVS